MSAARRARTTRPATPAYRTPEGTRVVTVQRVCDGCGGLLGNATRGELFAAVAGMGMPSVIAEHGCTAARGRANLRLVA